MSDKNSLTRHHTSTHHPAAQNALGPTGERTRDAVRYDWRATEVLVTLT